MQSDSQFGGSTPSIYNPHQSANHDPGVSNKSDFNKLYDHNEGKSSTRNYYDVDKIDFDKSIYLNGPPRSSESSSSDNSFLFDVREHEIENKITSNGIDERSTSKSLTNQPNLPRCKNSVENLSEDSGYGEFSSLKHRSKSIPNFNQDYFIEEEELENHKSLENIYSRPNFCVDTVNTIKNTEATYAVLHSKNRGERKNIIQASHGPKIDATKRCSHTAPSTIETKNIRGHGEVQTSDCSASRKAASSASASSLSLQNIISASLPDILDHLGVFGEINRSETKQRKNVSNSGNESVTPFYNKDFSVVSSVPNDLNYYSRDANSRYSEGSDRDDIDCWSFNSVSISSRHTSDSVASKNFDLGTLDCRLNVGSGSLTHTDNTLRQQKIINASYNNLTLLDYSSGADVRGSFRMMADKQKRASLDFSRGSSLLDEISAHFDRDLSIMNDQKRNYDPSDSIVRRERPIVRPTQPPPQPPPRRQNSNVKSDISDASISDDNNLIEPKDNTLSFEKEIKHLESRFTDSLEECNYTSDGSTDNEDDPEPPIAQSTPNKRDFIASTPNLYLVKRDCGEDFMQTHSVHNSMTILPQHSFQEKGKGILSDGSRNSLGKGVSFCPIVAEISWHEQSSEEVVESSGNDIR